MWGCGHACPRPLSPSTSQFCRGILCSGLHRALRHSIHADIVPRTAPSWQTSACVASNTPDITNTHSLHSYLSPSYPAFRNPTILQGVFVNSQVRSRHQDASNLNDRCSWPPFATVHSALHRLVSGVGFFWCWCRRHAGVLPAVPGSHRRDQVPDGAEELVRRGLLHVN